MKTTHSIDIDAPPAAVWACVSDVARWPELTASMSSVELLGATVLGDGARARVKQPRFPAMTWTVTRFEPERGFTWETAQPGVRTIALHDIEPSGEGRSRLTLVIDQRGPGSALLGLLYRGITRRYMAMEANGMKKAAEAPTSATEA